MESSPLDTKTDSISRLYEKAALFLSQYFKDGDYIGVSMGFTLHNVARTNRAFSKENHYMFVPILGGVSQGTVSKVDVQANQIAKEFAKKFGGTYTQFLTPAVFSERKVMEYFLKEKSVNYIFEDFKKLDTIVMGVGIPESGGSTLIQAGYLTKEEMDQYVKQGVAGMTFPMIKKIRNRIAIAGGANRAEAVKGAIRGGYVNMLITNNECAEKLL